MRLVDTSAWIEWLIGSPAGVLIGGQLPQNDRWLVPTIVQLELVKWITREIGEAKADQVIAFTRTCVVVDLDTEIAVSAAQLGPAHNLATADAIVYATSQKFDADLLTCDRHFDGLPGVRYQPKP